MHSGIRSGVTRISRRGFCAGAVIAGCLLTLTGTGAGAQTRPLHGKLFALPDDTLVYPGHDYEGRWVSSIAQEKQRNPRLGNDRPLDEFVAIMDGLDLAYPKFIDYALPGGTVLTVAVSTTICP